MEPAQDIIQALLGLQLNKNERPISSTENNGMHYQENDETGQTYAFARTTAHATTGFLNLPAELRLRVYDDILVSRFDKPSMGIGGTST